jgi:NB-ARC domain
LGLFLLQEAVKLALEQISSHTETQIHNKTPSKFRWEKKIFVGRRECIDEVTNFLTSSNCPVTLVGEGGIGKTALAFRIMHKCSGLFDIVIQIYLNSIIDYETFLSILARALGVKRKQFINNIDHFRQQIIDRLIL